MSPSSHWGTSSPGRASPAHTREEAALPWTQKHRRQPLSGPQEYTHSTPHRHQGPVPFHRTAQPGPWSLAHLKASRVDDLVANGAFHKHEVKLAFFFLHRIFLSCLATHEAHGSVGQHWLEDRENRTSQRGMGSRVGSLGLLGDLRRQPRHFCLLGYCLHVQGTNILNTRNGILSPVRWEG